MLNMTWWIIRIAGTTQAIDIMLHDQADYHWHCPGYRNNAEHGRWITRLAGTAQAIETMLNMTRGIIRIAGTAQAKTKNTECENSGVKGSRQNLRHETITWPSFR